MVDLHPVIGAVRHRRVEQRRQQILLDVPHLGRGLFQAVHHVLDVLGVELHQPGRHHAPRLAVPCDEDLVPAAAADLRQHVDHSLQGVFVHGVVAHQEFVVELLFEKVYIILICPGSVLILSRIDKILCITDICMIDICISGVGPTCSGYIILLAWS